MRRQTGHDGIVGSNAVLVTPGLEGLLKDEVAISMIGNHDILVARPCFDGEVAGIVCVEFADGDDLDEDLIGRSFGSGNWWGRGDGELGLGRTDVLALLGKMTHDGLARVGAVTCSIGVGEAIEGVAVAGLDDIQPCLLDWKAQACIVESDKCSHAG